jgi:hypothetical protein
MTGALAVPAARRRRRADQQQEPRQQHAGPAAGAPDAALAAARRRLPHRADRQVAPGLPAALRAAASGYDEFFGPMSGGVDYFSHCSSSGQHDLWLRRGEQHSEGLPHRPDQRRACEWVRAAEDQPFFLSLHYTAPHWPWETRDDAGIVAEVKGNLFHLHGGNIHTYRRMIHHMDEGIGALVEALRASGQARQHPGGLHQRQRRRALLRQLAAGGRQDGPDRRRHPRALDRALAGRHRPRRRERPALPDDGLVGHDARRRRRGRPPTTRWTASRCCRCCATPDQLPRPLYWRMNHRGQRAMRDGDWKYLRVDGHDYLFDIPTPTNASAPTSPPASPLGWPRCAPPGRPGTPPCPPIPPDATISLGYGAKDMPQR